MVFSGTKQTLVYDDTSKTNSLKLYNQIIKKEGSTFLYKNNKGKPVKYIENEPLFDEITELSEYVFNKSKNQYQHLKIQQKYNYTFKIKATLEFLINHSHY